MDVYFKKEITYKFADTEFRFDIANTLFSTFDLDHGTDILIRAIMPSSPKTILDLGCGYGPLGIMLAKVNPNAKVYMVDRDLLAVRYAAYNIKRNNVPNAAVLGSLGVEQVKDKTFDLIVANIPAKIGDDAITQEFILDPYHHLNPGGEYWFVIVTALNHLVPLVARRHDLHLKEIRKRNGHVVYMLKKSMASS